MMRRLISFRTGSGFYDNIGIFEGDAMDLQTRLVHEHEGVKEFLEELIKRECLEPAALGITKKVIAEGIESLTTNQRYVFDNYVSWRVCDCKMRKVPESYFVERNAGSLRQWRLLHSLLAHAPKTGKRVSHNLGYRT